MSKWNPAANEIFLQAVEIEAADDRQRHIARACGGDASLLLQVERLLAAHAAAGGFLENPAEEIEGTLEFSSVGRGKAGPIAVPRAGAGGPGQVIGRYTLIEEIGEGGMGSVYRARQTEPVRREVALKLVKAGIDSQQVVARFEAERQALAIMDHPSIAKVLDAGTTDSGRPYFVMELVHGVPITQYCDTKKLSIDERLRLFVPVCQAIQHAHHKGIIHRDIKPSNVLVTEVDGQAVPKVIDFGVAKAVQRNEWQQTQFTQHGQLVGTLEYMSPEQAGLTGDIDTRSDVYSLGVLLYELLTGSTPLDRDSLRHAAFTEILRRIREEEPPTPPVRLVQKTDTLPSVSAVRHIEPRKLSHLLRGDLTWIVMKALEKNRARRYDSAAGFAADVQRFLAHEPVEASPPSFGYKLRKFARKHRAAVLSATAIVALLVAGVAVSTVLAIRATNAERLAARRLVQVEDEKDRTQRALEETSQAKKKVEESLAASDRARRKAEAATNFLVNMLDAASPEKTLGQSVTVVEFTRQSAAEVDNYFADQPEVKAYVQNMLGSVLLRQGLQADARLHIERALEMRRGILPPDHPDTIISLNNLGGLLMAEGNFAEAEAALREAMAASTRHAGADDPATLDYRHNHAELLARLGRYDEARRAMTKVIALRRRLLGEDDPQTLLSRASLASLLKDSGELAEAERQQRGIIAAQLRTVGEDHPDTLYSQCNLAETLISSGQRPAAEELMRPVVERSRRVFGENHYQTRNAINLLSVALQVQGKLTEAEELLRDAVDDSQRLLGAEHPNTLSQMSNLAFLLSSRGQQAEAAELLDKVHDARRRALGDEHPETLTALNNRAENLHMQGKVAEAEPLLRQVVEQRGRILGGHHPQTLTSRNNLASLLANSGRLAEGIAEFQIILELRRRALGGEHPDTLRSANALALALQRFGKHDAAQALYAETFQTQRRVLGEDDPDTITTRNNLATLAIDRGRPLEALEPLRAVAEALARKFGADHTDTLTAWNNLAVVTVKAGQPEEAKALFEKVIAGRRRLSGENHPLTLSVEYSLGVLLHRQKNLAEAEKLLRDVLTRSRQALPAEHPRLADTAYALGLVLAAAERHEEAVPLLHEAFQLRLKRLPLGAAEFVETEMDLGQSLTAVKRFEPAQKLLTHAAESLLGSPMPDPASRTRSVQLVVDLYQAWGKPEEAEQWRHKLDASALPADLHGSEPLDAP